MGRGSGHCLAGSTPRVCCPSSSSLRLRVLFQYYSGCWQISVLCSRTTDIPVLLFFSGCSLRVTLSNLESWSPGLLHICCSLHGCLLRRKEHLRQQEEQRISPSTGWVSFDPAPQSPLHLGDGGGLPIQSWRGQWCSPLWGSAPPVPVCSALGTTWQT